MHPADLQTFITTLIDSNDRTRTIMGLITSAAALARDDATMRAVTADALLQTAIELDGDIKLRLMN